METVCTECGRPTDPLFAAESGGLCGDCLANHALSLTVIASRTEPGWRTKMDNPPAVGAPKDWPWGYLPCGCRNDGYGRHVR